MSDIIQEYPLAHLFVVEAITEVHDEQGDHEVSREDITGQILSIDDHRGIEQQDASLNADVGAFSIVIKDQISEDWVEADERFYPNLLLKVRAAFDSDLYLFSGRVMDCLTTYEMDEDGNRYQIHTISGTDRVDDLSNLTVEQIISYGYEDPENVHGYVEPHKETWPFRIAGLQRIAKSLESSDPEYLYEFRASELVYSL